MIGHSPDAHRGPRGRRARPGRGHEPRSAGGSAVDRAGSRAPSRCCCRTTAPPGRRSCTRSCRRSPPTSTSCCRSPSRPASRSCASTPRGAAPTGRSSSGSGRSSRSPGRGPRHDARQHRRPGPRRTRRRGWIRQRRRRQTPRRMLTRRPDEYAQYARRQGRHAPDRGHRLPGRPRGTAHGHGVGRPGAQRPRPRGCAAWMSPSAPRARSAPGSPSGPGT